MTDRSTESYEAFVADVIHDCLSSFQGPDHDGGFDRAGAVAYLLSEASGLRITLADDEQHYPCDRGKPAPACRCGVP